VIEASALAVSLQCRFAGLVTREAARARICSGWFREIYWAEAAY
jgi:hypothetical protein